MKKITEITVTFKMNDYDDVENYRDGDFLSPEDCLEQEDEEEFSQYMIKPTMEHLSNVDYSLNSPLIADETDEFMKWCLKPGKNLRWNVKLWSNRKMGLGPTFKSNNLVPTGDFHKQWALFNQSKVKQPTLFRTLFSSAVNNANKTKEIPISFFRGWLKEELNWNYKDNIPQSIMKWGDLFWELHVITLILNSVTRSEVLELQQKFKCKDYVQTDKVYSQELKTINFGTIVVSWGFVWFKDLRWFMDRNTLLMMKDTYVGRFHTLLAMFHRCDDVYTEEDRSTMSLVYGIGDKIIGLHGILGYKVIKLVEPLCNLRLCEIARSYRPAIPEFPAFRRHISITLNKLRLKDGVSGRELAEMITKIKSVNLLFAIFSSFRHWGHPFINYRVGLAKLFKQVNVPKEIDHDYVQLLASDLAKKVLETKFQEKQIWFVDKEKVPKNHILYNYIQQGTWPEKPAIEKMEGKWHLLPLTKVFEIPDLIDPSVIYSDKSHSMDRNEIVEWMRLHPGQKIPSKKVLSTMLNKPATNWPVFLQRIEDEGLSKNSLVIGLQAKEREIKDEGRFFSLMSWELREYFVVTEYLIKEHFVPLFHGLTMADDLTTVMKKMLDNTIGQGGKDYTQICIANHFDYEKWNNHQRKESNGPIFRVMGQFLGYPSLIERTHEFFEKSWIYYKDRADCLEVKGDRIYSTEGQFCWNGQLGGLEGLRQKGWSILNLLVINRESKIRNTMVKCLAQGDNQVIFTSYKIEQYRTNEERNFNIRAIVQNNNEIIDSISNGTKKLGLLINHDETIQSADYMIYGKVPVFRGVFQSLETKRWSRVTCVTNDQLPTLASIMSSVVSNALTVAHSSHSPKNPIFHYFLLGNLAYELIGIHDPALRGSIARQTKNPEHVRSTTFRNLLLYLDPSMGGVSGVSLTRFLIRMFPDPITESLSFLKIVHDNTKNIAIKTLMRSAGFPRLAIPTLENFSRLLEDPSSLNIKHGAHPNSLIRNLIRDTMFEGSWDIKNDIIRDAVHHTKVEDPHLNKFLYYITPAFPRFLAEYRASTYVGIVDSLIGLFENSKTIRNQFKKSLGKSIDLVIIKSELASVNSLIILSQNLDPPNIWHCSTYYADKLRRISWGKEIYGATIPHPIEALGYVSMNPSQCIGCTKSYPENLFVALMLNEGLHDYTTSAGPYKAYLGSKTSETTSIMQPWEREGKIPVIKRAAKLRDAIGWFIDPTDYLAESILQNLQALTGEDWSGSQVRGRKTGSALHRYGSSRQSSGGYAAQNPAKLTRMILTTNPMASLGEINHNIMFQTFLIYAQATIGELHDHKETRVTAHIHLTCKDCIQPIGEIQLTSHYKYRHPDVHNKLARWKPDGSAWSDTRKKIEVRPGDWNALNHMEKSWAIGLAEAFVFIDLELSKNRHAEDSSIFPLSLSGKLNPREYCMGLIEGVLRATMLYIVTRSTLLKRNLDPEILWGSAFVSYKALSRNIGLINLWRGSEFERLFRRVPHRISPQYPATNDDIGHLGLTYLMALAPAYLATRTHRLKDVGVWIFSELNTPIAIARLGLAGRMIEELRSSYQKRKEVIRSCRMTLSLIQGPEDSWSTDDLMSLLTSFRFTDQEIRHSLRGITRYDPVLFPIPKFRLKQDEWGEEICGSVKSILIEYHKGPYNHLDITIPRIQNPLISGLRTFQCATGSHYKVRSILKYYNIKPVDALVGGDGSGGLGSLVLRTYKMCNIIFNSLLDLTGVDLRGSDPGPPSAINAFEDLKERCVNLQTCWQNPSDLSRRETWDYFRSLIKNHKMSINLIILDMEVKSSSMIRKIEQQLANFCVTLSEVTIIFKTFAAELLGAPNVLTTVGRHFSNVYLTTTQFTSSQSSEVYVVMQGLYKTINNPHTPILTLQTFQKIRLPALQSIDSELIRAYSLSGLDMMKGVPRQYFPDTAGSVQLLLDRLGLKANYVNRVTKILSEQKKNNSTLASLALMILMVHGLMDTISGYDTQMNPPSNGTVENIGSVIIGHMLWFGWAWKHGPLIKKALFMIEKCFPFTWILKSERYSTKMYHYNRCSLAGHKGVQKYLHLDHKMALIGQIIRIFDSTFYLGGIMYDSTVLNSHLRQVVRHLTVEKFNENTTILGLYSDGIDLKKSVQASKGFTVTAVIDNSKGDRAWIE
ncbi:RNA-dependent RNA polymerase [Drosophila obscura sigmavirus 10A]|uniref:Replicase n=85 Tax=Drosophila obscura sigmavirus TaxID=948741 RepID=C8CJF1_9RHAB|nr:RNA-dependent RNA polymerase [Drosophila obscura sigmavirus 10A]ACU65444.1 RNA-dependent RNA polymerase [Drosophila obscura sigmavirus 10A]